jgi:hypothetical protein
MKKLQILKQQLPGILKGAAVETLNNRAVRLGLGVAGACGLGGTAHADAGTPPLDFTSTATTIAGYVPSAATAGLTIFAAVFGVIVIKRVFMTVA